MKDVRETKDMIKNKFGGKANTGNGNKNVVLTLPLEIA
jgi:hypothetical protein